MLQSALLKSNIYFRGPQTESGLYISPGKLASRLFERKSKIVQSEVQTNRNNVKKILDVWRVTRDGWLKITFISQQL